MRIVTLIACILLPVTVLAGDCAVYELRGAGVKKNGSYGIVIAQGSSSESYFPMEQKNDYKVLPYIKRWFEGTVIMNKKTLVITDVIDGDIVLSDVLDAKNSYRKFVKEAACTK